MAGVDQAEIGQVGEEFPAAIMSGAMRKDCSGKMPKEKRRME